jgi:predicted DNA-binding transcriptional regulator YafY
VQATVLAPPPLVGVLRSAFGRTLTVGSREADGRVALTIGANEPEMLAWQLAGWAERVEVVEPPEIRNLLADIGRRLVARYQDPVP